MDSGKDRAIPAGQRRALTMTALLPAAVGLLAWPVAQAGRGAWLCPWLALPVGLLLCRTGDESLPGEGEKPLGRAVAVAYLMWGVVLLWGSAGRFAGRLLKVTGEGGRAWALLAVTLAVTLYLTRRGEVLCRAGGLFFPAAALLVGSVLLLTLPSADWRSMGAVTGRDLAGVPAGAAGVLSLSGYAVYGRCIDREKGAGGGKKWCLWGCGALSLLLLALTGVFSPALIGHMDEPFLYLLGGVGVAGAFQRGEAVLSALTGLGDLALFGLVSRGCAQLWQELWGEGEWLPAAAGFWLAAIAPAVGAGFLAGPAGIAGNLAAGTGLPLLVLLIRRRSRGAK